MDWGGGSEKRGAFIELSAGLLGGPDRPALLLCRLLNYSGIDRLPHADCQLA